MDYEVYLLTNIPRNMKKIICIAIVIGCVLTACKHSQTKENLNEQDSLTVETEQVIDTTLYVLNLFGIPLQGENKAEVVDKLLGQVSGMKLVEKREDVTVVNFCGIEFGLNMSFDSIPNQVSATSVLLLTSKKDKKTFERLKKGIEQYYGTPDVEEYEEGEEEFDGRFSGRCNWYRDCEIILRSQHGEEGGFGVMFSPIREQ